MTIPIIEKLLETVMKSEPMERVLGIESTAIVTGRASQYDGITIQEVLKSALEEAYDAGREAEAIGCSDHCEKAKKEALEKISKKCEELGIDGEATVFEDVAVPHSCVEYRAALQTIIAYLDIKI